MKESHKFLSLCRISRLARTLRTCCVLFLCCLTYSYSHKLLPLRRLLFIVIFFICIIYSIETVVVFFNQFIVISNNEVKCIKSHDVLISPLINNFINQSIVQGLRLTSHILCTRLLIASSEDSYKTLPLRRLSRTLTADGSAEKYS